MNLEKVEELSPVELYFLLLGNSGVLERVPLTLLIGLAAALTLVYTMRAFMRIWWHDPAEGITVKTKGDRLYAPMILVSLILALGVFAEPLVNIAWEAARWLAVPEIYIDPVLHP